MEGVGLSLKCDFAIIMLSKKEQQMAEEENIVKRTCKELDKIEQELLKQKKADIASFELLKEKALKLYYIAKALQ